MNARATRAFQHVEFRFIAYLLMAILFPFYLLVLTGCLSTSPGVPNLFLLKLQVKGEEGVEVRVGYYGICVIEEKGDGPTCLPTFGKTPEILGGMFLAGPANATQAVAVKMLLAQANIIQNKIFRALLAVSGGLFFLSVMSMLLLKRYIKNDKPDVSKQKERFKSGMQLFRQLAFGLAVAAAFSTTQATGALNFATNAMTGCGTNILITGGKAAQAMQWTIVALLCVVHLAISAMFGADDSATGADATANDAPGGTPRRNRAGSGPPPRRGGGPRSSMV